MAALGPHVIWVTLLSVKHPNFMQLECEGGLVTRPMGERRLPFTPGGFINWEGPAPPDVIFGFMPFIPFYFIHRFGV